MVIGSGQLADLFPEPKQVSSSVDNTSVSILLSQLYAQKGVQPTVPKERHPI